MIFEWNKISFSHSDRTDENQVKIEQLQEATHILSTCESLANHKRNSLNL